ncbi:hypothetical protein [Rhizobium sp. NFACC06-2]|uniref:hypothetical protein n=1 Tax=Rhizobium/Agrobacterium group TaxID=227290 RepID=UPI00122C5B8C|nr:hypothetical protein [Rhizobium sp. NFACC06-2]
MSNASLVQKIEQSLLSLCRREILPSSAASSFLLNGRALEALPYHLVKEMEDIGMDLEIAAWHDKEEFSPHIGPVISRAEEWLAKVPR